jgi:ABC-2 type transport system permease protein
MTVWLVAEREFRAYAGTVSFAVALLIAPLLTAGVLLAGRAVSRPPAPVVVQLAAPGDAALLKAAHAALADAAAADGRAIAIVEPVAVTAGARIVLSRGPGERIAARMDGGAPLSTAGRALFARDLERAEARRRWGEAGPAVDLQIARAAPAAADVHAFARFSTVMILWLTLTGSLGMLLQAVVRERGNRSLESLLAAASPAEIVFGKLLGVGAVSALVMASWLGSSAALTAGASGGAAFAAGLAQDLASPAALIRACVLYVAAYGFFGLVAVALGAAARDSAAAQNLARPLFAVLLAAFFAALAAAAGARLGWLVYVPPLTPFMLLLRPLGQAWSPGAVGALASLLAATAVAAAWAVQSLSLNPKPFWPVRQAAKAIH